MFSLELECKQEDRDLLIAELWEQGSNGIQESDAGDRLRAFFEDDTDPIALAMHFVAYPLHWREEAALDWVEIANAKLTPMLAGSRFYLVPKWRSDPAPPGRLRIEVNSGLAFGTGVHETTQLCLENLERLVKTGLTVLDVGAGSGILSQAAKLLGAGRVIACDIDPTAVEVARANGVACFVGSAQAVKSRTAGLIVANISPDAIRELAHEMLRCLCPDGVAIASGFENHETAEVSRAIQAAGGQVRESCSKGAWSALLFSA
jgi:ribosomal protein L11 methyltransferase